MKEQLIECYEENKHIPEKALLAAMLELAIRDLVTGGMSELKSAIEWFTGTKKDYKSCISYMSLVEFLELGEGVVAKIKVFVDQAEARRENLKKVRRQHLKGQCPNSDLVSTRKDGKASLRHRRARVFSR